MRNSELRAYTPAAILLLGCALILNSTHKQVALEPVGSLKTIMSDVPGYRIQEQTVPDEERKVAGMTDYVARVYWRPDSTVAFTTYVGYYDQQTQGHSMHSPKNCLPGAGWEILHNGTTTVAAADGQQVVNRVLLKDGREEALVYYWYQGRGRVVASEYRVKFNLLRDAALTGHTEEALVRLVVPLGPSDSTEALADQLAAKVAPQLLNDVQRVIPKDGADQPASSVAALTLSRR